MLMVVYIKIQNALMWMTKLNMSKTKDAGACKFMFYRNI